MEITDDFAAWFNLAEGCLWIAIAAILAWRLRRRPQPAGVYRILPAAFAVFGLSDFIESRTGAFWRPWWLLGVKGACVLVFAAAGMRHRQDRQRNEAGKTRADGKSVD